MSQFKYIDHVNFVLVNNFLKVYTGHDRDFFEAEDLDVDPAKFSFLNTISTWFILFQFAKERFETMDLSSFSEEETADCLRLIEKVEGHQIQIRSLIDTVREG